MDIKVDNKLRVNEIFTSIQGEGVYTGVPMNFIRLQGCNFYPNTCIYCDTKDAQNVYEGYTLTIKEVIQKLEDLGANLGICITGGEPLSQNIETLIYNIENFIEIETNGSLPPPEWFSIINSWVVDYKLPSANVPKSLCNRYWREWEDVLKVKDQVKFVVAHSSDLPIIMDVIKSSSTLFQVLISPSFPYNKELFEITFNFAIRNNFRLSLQIHKLINAR